MIQYALYAQIIIMCMFIDGLILFQLLNDIGQTVQQKALERVFKVCMLLMLSDLVWAMHDMGLYTLPMSAAHVVNMLYFLFSGMASWCWFEYSQMRMGAGWLKKQLWSWLMRLPVLVLACLIMVNPLTGWIFTISNGSEYVRGPLYILQMILSYCYLVPAALHALIYAFRAKSHEQRNEGWVLAAFMILPVIGGIAQTLLPGMPMLLAGSALSMLMLHINLQGARISVDALTHINNRNSFYQYINAKSGTNCEKLWMLFLDGDHFKQINDTYGHNAGDDALVRVADALKRSVPFDGFIARFGGDEFVMLFEAENYDQVNTVINRIHRELQLLNESASTPYSIQVSIGAASWNSGMHSMESLISAADEALYHVKQNRPS